MDVEQVNNSAAKTPHRGGTPLPSGLGFLLYFVAAIIIAAFVLPYAFKTALEYPVYSCAFVGTFAFSILGLGQFLGGHVRAGIIFSGLAVVSVVLQTIAIGF